MTNDYVPKNMRLSVVRQLSFWKARLRSWELRHDMFRTLPGPHYRLSLRLHGLAARTGVEPVYQP